MLKISDQTAHAITSCETWLLESGIQSKEGFFYAWYDGNQEEFSYPYPEITGYGITAFCFLNSIHPDNMWIQGAERAADWTCAKAIAPEGGVKSRFSFQPEPQRRAELSRLYAFDSAMAGYGLLQIHSVTGKKQHLDGAKRLYHFLTSRLRRDDGSFNAFFDEQARTHGADPDRWSGIPGGFGAKLGLFLLEMAKHEPAAKEVAERLLDHTAQVRKLGTFEGNQLRGSVEPHAHAYTLEGLLSGYIQLNKQAYLDALLDGHLWLKKHLASQSDLSTVRMDAIAQALRLSLILGSLGMTAEKPWQDILRDHLLASQITEGPQKGAWPFRVRGESENHANAWVTFFALQALCYLDESIAPRMRSLSSFI